MKQIGVITATRAEYGVFRNVIRLINDDPDLDLRLIVTGTHLSKAFGYTVKEIEKDGFPIDSKIDILMDSDSSAAMSKAMGLAMLSFADVVANEPMDMVIVLGDRYELIPFCCCAMNQRIPIAHISGGETTEGAIDESVRHCITKMSYLHFPGCERYRQRIIQLGEDPGRVFNFGDVGVENIEHIHLLDKNELEESLALKLEKPYAVVTFHPVTLNTSSVSEQCLALFRAIQSFPNMDFIITKANADAGGREINHLIDEFVRNKMQKNVYAFTSLGILRYLSLLKYSDMVIGNSSSGIIEAPCFGIPTVNIGDRQAGRLRANSVIDCDNNEDNIIVAIKKAITREFKVIAKNSVNPYGGGNTSADIVSTIKDFLLNNKIDLKKKFYDLPVEVLK